MKNQTIKIAAKKPTPTVVSVAALERLKDQNVRLTDIHGEEFPGKIRRIEADESDKTIKVALDNPTCNKMIFVRVKMAA